MLGPKHMQIIRLLPWSFTEVLLKPQLNFTPLHMQVMMEEGTGKTMLSYSVLSRVYQSWDYIMDRCVEFMFNPDFQPVMQQKFDMIIEIG